MAGREDVPPSGETKSDKDERKQSPECGDQSAKEAFKSNVDAVPVFDEGGPVLQWNRNWNESAGGNYDPCADLSFITVGIEMPTVSSPSQLMLFHRGEYLGVATK